MIPEVQKEFVRDLVESHSESGFDDIVRDKGKGLVGLLSGPPGVGKTLTAEAVAEIARRPLYTITSGELGSKAESVQSGLDSLMELSEAWNAVVLLDEADVFLMERDNGNLARNAITSIFLRRLEYYQGILILTTNRQTTFDPAFKSRIHFTIDYPDLDASSRKEIWTTFITRASASGKVETNITDDECDKLAELPLNGRQIKNIINISQTVAVRRKTPITYERTRVAMRFSGHSFDEHTDSSARGS
jgi:SpoVK/Ycf46/Vps4 family AAA+-type ATPase